MAVHRWLGVVWAWTEVLNGRDIELPRRKVSGVGNGIGKGGQPFPVGMEQKRWGGECLQKGDGCSPCATSSP